MGWTIEELVLQLEQDPERRVLFVEGVRDLRFWKEIVPVQDRGNTVIYAAESLEIAVLEGGEKGRLLACAHELARIAMPFERVAFFLDADSDRFLGVVHPQSVILTDGRCLESYVLNQECIQKLLDSGAHPKIDSADELLSAVESTVRPLGILRIVSDLRNLKLPFIYTFEKKGCARYFISNKEGYGINLEAVVQTLLQNCKKNIGLVPEIVNLVQELGADEGTYSTFQVVRGRDLIEMFAWILKTGNREAEVYIFMSISRCIDTVKAHQNIQQVESWIRMAA